MTAFATLTAAAGLAACGSSSSTSTQSSSSRTSSATQSASATPAAANADVAKATAAIAPYLDKPSPFPVTQKLKAVPTGATFDYMSCGTPVCALLGNLIGAAGKAMGVKVVDIDAGDAANTVAAGFDTAVSEKPTAVLSPAISIQLWSHQLQELQKLNIPVVTTGVTGLSKYHVPAPQGAEAQAALWGRLPADYVAAELGQHSNVVFYEVPELPFTLLSAAAFKTELARVCPGCTFRTSDISAATIGNTAPSTVVADLQAHPSTTVAVFGSDEAETGLPAALKSAGIHVKTIGVAPTPANLEYVKQGGETATFGYDIPVAAWELVDQAAREVAHQPLVGIEAQGIIDGEFLTQKDITFNPAGGWTGYPDFAQRFMKLWGVSH